MLRCRAVLAMFAVVTGLQILAAQPPAQETSRVTGVWTGAVVLKAAGETHEEPLYTVLKQDGGMLTGTAGPDADRQYRINNGKVTTAKDATAVTFEVIVNGVHMAVDMKLADDALKGTAAIEGEDGQRHTAAVNLKRAKVP